MVVPGTAPKASPELADTEEWQDVEVAHAVTPGAAIRVALADTSSNLGSTEVRTLQTMLSASQRVDVVSASCVVPEGCFNSAQLAEARPLISQLASRHITVTAASGDP